MIRRAAAGDAESLTKLMHASAAYSGRYAGILDGYAVTSDQIRRDIVFLAEVGGQIVGFYSLILADEAELDLMFVADGLHGAGLGQRLFEHMREEARPGGAAFVRIVSHPPSAGFYERMGATIVGTMPSTRKAGWERPILKLTV